MKGEWFKKREVKGEWFKKREVKGEWFKKREVKGEWLKGREVKKKRGERGWRVQSSASLICFAELSYFAD